MLSIREATLQRSFEEFNKQLSDPEAQLSKLEHEHVKEIEKCEKKLALVSQSAEKLRRTVMDEKNVPETVREANKEKLETYETEITVLKQTAEMFASLK